MSVLLPTVQTIDLDGPVSYVDYPGPGDGRARSEARSTMILVHGLGASLVSWVRLAPLQAVDRRVLALDLVGFGDSIPRGRSSTVSANARLLGRFVEAVAADPVTLVGNSMGGMVSVLLATQRPELVSSLILVDPALPLTITNRTRRPDPTVAAMFALYSLPGVGERFLAKRRDSVSPEQQVHELLNLVCADPSLVPGDVVEAMVETARHRRQYRWAHASFLEAERSIFRTFVRRPRYSTLLASITQRTLLLHGTEDRLVDVGAARVAAAANPRIDLVELPGVGHAPQIEVPNMVADAIQAWAKAPLT